MIASPSLSMIPTSLSNPVLPRRGWRLPRQSQPRSRSSIITTGTITATPTRNTTRIIVGLHPPLVVLDPRLGPMMVRVRGVAMVHSSRMAVTGRSARGQPEVRVDSSRTHQVLLRRSVPSARMMMPRFINSQCQRCGRPSLTGCNPSRWRLASPLMTSPSSPTSSTFTPSFAGMPLEAGRLNPCPSLSSQRGRAPLHSEGPPPWPHPPRHVSSQLAVHPPGCGTP
jgi:hypothetical protein